MFIKIKNGDSSMRGKVIPHFASDWCNKNHFDYRGLIEKGLALKAPEDMYSKEIVGVKETPTKTFPRVNNFKTAASYRR